MQIFDKGKIYNFMSIRWVMFALSGVLFFGSIALLFTKGLNYGIDFAGGTLIQVKYHDKDAPIDLIRQKFASNEILKNASITEFGSASEITIRYTTH